jgi:hypothetical protein
MSIAGLDLDPLLSAIAPIASMIGIGIAVLAIMGIAAYIIIQMRKNNTLIFPWEYKWHILAWRPTGNTTYPFIDEGCTIFEGRMMKLRLKSLGFAIPFPTREFIHPGNWIEGFSNGFRHFVIIKRTFTGYHNTPDIRLLKQLAEVDNEIEKQKYLATVEAADKQTIEKSEKAIENLENIRKNIEGKLQEGAGLDNAYEPELDVNATNVQIHENEKIALNFPNMEGISKEMIMLGLMVMIFFLSALFYLQSEGKNADAMTAQAASNDRQTAAMLAQTDVLNRTLSLVNYSMMHTNYPMPTK